jgi:4-diphosphocytidyl-2-C-methyl-D-erythritol kinase
MIVFPPCKINLGLNILRKRVDGFHDLETVFYPVPFTDVLEAVEVHGAKEKVSLQTYGLSVSGNPNNNLVLKAYHLLDNAYDLPPTEFCLYKNIPMGAGLGGGSADGAYAIRLLNDLYQLNLSIETQLSFASQLGSDCAFFIYDSACKGEGRGEILEPISLTLNGYYLCLVKPHIHISTAEAFAGIKPKEKSAQELAAYWVQQNIDKWQTNLNNDFEASLFPKYPILAELKETFLQAGAVYAAMSGSGSTIFALFKQAPKLAAKFEGHFYQEIQL